MSVSVSVNNLCLLQVFPSASTLAEHKLSHCKVMRGDVCVVCKLVMKTEDQFYIHSQEHGVQVTIQQFLFQFLTPFYFHCPLIVAFDILNLI